MLIDGRLFVSPPPEIFISHFLLYLHRFWRAWSCHVHRVECRGMRGGSGVPGNNHVS